MEIILYFLAALIVLVWMVIYAIIYKLEITDRNPLPKMNDNDINSSQVYHINSECDNNIADDIKIICK